MRDTGLQNYRAIGRKDYRTKGLQDYTTCRTKELYTVEGMLLLWDIGTGICVRWPLEKIFNPLSRLFLPSHFPHRFSCPSRLLRLPLAFLPLLLCRKTDCSCWFIRTGPCQCRCRSRAALREAIIAGCHNQMATESPWHSERNGWEVFQGEGVLGKSPFCQIISFST